MFILVTERTLCGDHKRLINLTTVSDVRAYDGDGAWAVSVHGGGDDGEFGFDTIRRELLEPDAKPFDFPAAVIVRLDAPDLCVVESVATIHEALAQIGVAVRL